MRRVCRLFPLFWRVAVWWLAALGPAAALGAPPSPLTDPRVSKRFFLPETTGPFKVGFRQVLFSDTSRDEPTTEASGDVRTWVGAVFYPAKVKPGDARMAYMDPLSAVAWAKLRHFWQRFERNVFTRAFQDAPVLQSDEPFPVVIFSHDLFCLPENYHALLTDLASHGYVVVAINHAYASAATMFPSGSFVTDRIWANGFANMKSGRRAMTEYLSTWVADIRFVVDDLSRRNKDEAFFLSGRLDMSKIGVWGQGYGGWAAASALVADDRIIAGVAQESRIQDKTRVPMLMAKPLLHIVGAADSDLIGTQYRSDHADLAQVVIDGASRASFEDAGLLRQRFDRSTSAVQKKKRKDLHALRSIRIARAYVLAFFDRYLRGRNLGILAADQSPYAEAHLTWTH